MDLQCSYGLNQNGPIENDGEGENIFLDPDNPLHEQMLLLALPHHGGAISTDQQFPSGSEVMETIIVMPDSNSGQCHLPSSQIIVVHDSCTSVVGSENVCKNQIGQSQPLQPEVQEQLGETDTDHSLKSCDVDEIKSLDSDKEICIEINLNDSPVQIPVSEVVVLDAEEIQLQSYESKYLEQSDIMKSLRPRLTQVIEVKPNSVSDTEFESEVNEEEEVPPMEVKPKFESIGIDSDDEFEEGDSYSEDEEQKEFRKCIVCLRHRDFVDCIFDDYKELYHHVEIMLKYVDVHVKRFSHNIGICPECFDQLQRWHIFSSAISKRHETAISTGEKFIDEPVAFETVQVHVYRNFKKMGKVKEVYLAATHAHFARRHLSEKDWDYFCDHLFHSNSVKSEKSKELERFLVSQEKLSQLFCTKCNKLIPDGKDNYTKHMESVHSESPVMYPCDICGVFFPDKDMTASTEDYYPHWISHFYFDVCEDCGKRFPTKRALGQHRHAVHKNRQVKCERCGKVLANKMSLDLHLLRHLPDNEKKKYMIKCKICKKRIAQWNMKSHISTHNDDRPWKCDHCDSTFKMKGALVSHRDVVHFNLRNHVCGICGEAFKSASSLRGHVRRHEGRKDYKCEVCLKEYYTYSALKGHKVVHQTTRDFICDVCGKAFKKKKALEEHVTIHTGVKPHQCPVCGREIRVKSNLYKHMKIHKKIASEAFDSLKRTKKKNDEIETEDITRDKTFLGKIESSGSSSNNHEQPRTTAVLTETLPSTSTVLNIDTSSDNKPILATTSMPTNPVQFTMQPLPQATNFISPHFQTNRENLVDSISMQHQHQDLLNVPIIPGHFYPTTGQQYFTPFDPLQNSQRMVGHSSQ